MLLATDLADLFYNGMFLGAIAFIVVYSRTAPWWKHLVGRAMVSFDAIVFLTLLPGILHLWFGVHIFNDFFEWYRVVTMAIGTGLIVWRTWTVHHVNAEVTQAPSLDSVPADMQDTIKEIR